MKIFYLLFAFLFLAFLSEPGYAQQQRQCRNSGGRCLYSCGGNFPQPGGKRGCPGRLTCCLRRYGK